MAWPGLCNHEGIAIRPKFEFPERVIWQNKQMASSKPRGLCHSGFLILSSSPPPLHLIILLPLYFYLGNAVQQQPQVGEGGIQGETETKG